VIDIHFRPIYKIDGYEIDGHEKFKSMLDKVVISREKTITPYDLKCVWSVEGFYEVLSL
jgi:hypothetical protein